MSRVPPPNDRQRLAVALRDALRLRRRTRRGSGRRPRRRTSPARTDALACRLTKRSALLLLASAARSSRPTVCVVVARQEHADAEARLERRLQPPRDRERDVLLERAAGRRARRPRRRRGRRR